MATGEVAAVLSAFEGVTQANVYGVQVQGYDGRAGMASLVSEENLDLSKLKAHIEASLPHYARPVFLRLSKETDTTSTFKYKKTNLVKAGFDPSKCAESVYVLNSDENAYVEIDSKLFEDINTGHFRL